jgi:type II secretory ATPase GspE/PulE/Tfp pilus assembly ATPase PilB-like protein
VLATIHTNDAASAVVRLTEMGIEPFLIASSLRGVLAQRLARRLCPQCREPTPVPQAALADIITFEGALADLPDPVAIHRPRGCSRCTGSGYRGRFGLAEMLVVSESIERLIVSRAAAIEIRAVARAEGMRTMGDEGLAGVLTGHTSLEELGRVVR